MNLEFWCSKWNLSLNPEKRVFTVFIGKLKLNPSILLFELTLQLTQLTSLKTLELLLMITFHGLTTAIKFPASLCFSPSNSLNHLVHHASEKSPVLLLSVMESTSDQRYIKH